MNRYLTTTAAVAALNCSNPATVFAHHTGGSSNTGGAGPIKTISATTLESGHGVAGIVVEYARMKPLSDDTLVAATASGNKDVHSLETQQSYALSMAYGVTNDLTVSLHLPYVKRTGIRAAEVDEDTGDIEAEEHGQSDGIGDFSMLGQYRFYNDTQTRTEAALLLGFTAPTGPTNRRSLHNELLDAEFQPGSGAWGGLFGVAVTRRSGPWSFDANVLYNLVTEGTQATDLGDVFLYNAAVSYRLYGFSGARPMFHGSTPHRAGDSGHQAGLTDVPSGPALDLVLELNGQVDNKLVAGGVMDENSGEHTLNISPGLRLSWGQASAFVSAGIPIINHFDGIHSENDWQATTGMMVSF